MHSPELPGALEVLGNTGAIGLLPAGTDDDDEPGKFKMTDSPVLNPARVSIPNISPTAALFAPGLALAFALLLGEGVRDFTRPTAPAGGAPELGDDDLPCDLGAIERPLSSTCRNTHRLPFLH